MARTIAGKTVLPDLPPAPRMTQFPQVNLAADTLPAFNAMGQGLAPNSPLTLHAPQMPKSPFIHRPCKRKRIPRMETAVMGERTRTGNCAKQPHALLCLPEVKFAEFEYSTGK